MEPTKVGGAKIFRWLGARVKQELDLVPGFEVLGVGIGSRGDATSSG
jgi:hypothetical protein